MSDAIVEQEFTRVEQEVRRRWADHGLPAPSGTVGRGTGPVLRQILGMYTPGDPPALVAHRAVVADVDARATALAGGRAFGTLRRDGWPAGTADPVIGPLLEALGVWTGGSNGQAYDAEDRTATVQRLTGRLARAGLLVVLEGPVRLCVSCAAPRSPERTIYHEEVGDTFLVRFPLEPDADGAVVEALAWVDAPWRLLGATALLVNPDLHYATVEYRRGEVTARLLTLRSSLKRLQAWLPGVELTIVDERPGRAFAGRRYTYPLRHEFPDGASLSPPSGTVQAVPEVGDSGTGVVPLVPGHGGTDAQIAERIGVRGWPLLTLRGTLEQTLMHKYSGLDLESANEFVARDLTEGGSVLARLRVLRGVPYCGVCGRPLVWVPGRCWCLQLGRMPAPITELYAHLLPHDRLLTQLELTAWPASETRPSDGAGAITLLECDRCSRLDAPDGPAECPCGGRRRPVSRRLAPSLGGALAAWARNEGLGAGDTMRLYVGERRRAPAVAHQLAALAAFGSARPEVRATIVPTVTDVDVVGLVRELGADAVRSALVRVDGSEGPGGSFVERCHQEHGRLSRFTALASTAAATLDGDPAPALGVGGLGTDRELQPEDRALLARWAAVEIQALAAYEELRAGEAHRRLVRFLEVDLAQYLELVRPRLQGSTPSASRRVAARALAGVVAAIATDLAPVAPFTAEAVVRSFRPGGRSLFETEPFDVDHPPPDEGLAEAWDRWLAVVRGVERFRADRHLPAGTVIPSVALVVADDQLGDQLRGDRALIERLAGIGRLDVGSPRTPWAGRKRQLVPVESEIQKAYPTIASQVVYLLRRMPPQRAGLIGTARGVSVVLQGQPLQIAPSMVSFVETLPERVFPVPFGLGEMYAELPSGRGLAEGRGGLDLSVDAAWLVRRVARRLHRAGPEKAHNLAVRVVAVDPLAQELRERWAAIAAQLGVASLTIDSTPSLDSGPPSVTGRTRLGARWAVEIPGLEGRPAVRPRFVRKAARQGTRRMPLRRPVPAVGERSVDLADDREVARGEAVRALGEQLDKLLEAPLLGPAKVTMAWEAGYTSADAITTASFDELQTLPGFGRPVAARLFSKLGRTVPPPPPRPRRPPKGASAVTAPPPLAPAPVALVPRTPAPAVELARPDASPVSPEPFQPAETGPVASTASPPAGDRATEAGLSDRETTPSPPALVPAEPSPGAPSGPDTGGPVLPTVPAAPVPPPESEPPAPPPRAPAPPPPLEPAFLSEAAHAARTQAQVPPTVPSAPAPPVGLEVDVSDTLLTALQPFLESTAAGHRGVAVVRELPERTRALVGPRPVAVYWLTNLSRDRAIRPGDLAGLATLLRQGIEANGISAVFLEGFEYLTQIHGIEAVITFLGDLDRLAREHRARVWLHLTPGLISGSDLQRILTSVGGVSPPTEPAPAEQPDPPAPG